MPRPNEIRLAPIQPRKGSRRKKTTVAQAPQYKAGVKHTVEGFNPPDRIVTTTTPRKLPRGHKGYDLRMENAKTTRSVNKGYTEWLASFKKKQAMRLNIPSLPDSEALNLDEQRTSVRRRMRGRLGTMLTERETLGR